MMFMNIELKPSNINIGVGNYDYKEIINRRRISGMYSEG